MESEFNVYVLGENRPTPGPGAYKIPSTIGSGPRASISPRFQSTKKREDPSIVALPSTIGNGPKIAMSFRTRGPKEQATPGPDYVPPSFGSNSPRITFPKAKQSRKKKSKSKSTNYDRTPGPGSYSPRLSEIGSEAKMGSFPHSARNTVFDKKPNNTPVYSPNYQAVMKSSPRYPIAHKPSEKSHIVEGSEFIASKSTLKTTGSQFPRSGRKQVVH